MSSAPAEEVLIVQEQEGVLVLTMNRPSARNAMSLALATSIAEALAEFDERPELRVVVLTGAGGTFCAGMDLKGFAERGELPIVPGRGFGGVVEQPPRKPFITAVEGYALGGGFELALASDLIVASDTAVFGLPEVKRGLTANAGGLLRLPERIPYHRAMELILTGRMLPSAEAEGLGLVTRVVPAGEALEAALELARTIGANAPLAVATSKQVIQESRDWPVKEKFERQRPLIAPIRTSNDAKEGARAFAEKRAPVWTAS